MKRLTLMLGMLLALAAPAFAQTPIEEPDPVNYLAYLAIAINTVLIPLAVRVAKPLWAGLPVLVKTLVPTVVGPLLVTGGLWLSSKLGAPVDLTLLQEIWLGIVAGAGASMTFKMGETHGRK